MIKTNDSQIQDSKEWDKVFMNPRFKNNGYSWRNKDYRYLDKFINLSNFSGSLLDVGCAFGDGLLYFKEKCPNIKNFVGCDYSSEVIKICKMNKKLKEFSFFQCDITKPLKKKYDIITCLQTIEHIPYPKKALKTLLKAVNGCLIISVPYMNRRRGKSHLWEFNEDDFSDLFDFYVLDQKDTEGKFKGLYRNIYWVLNKKI